MAHYTNHKRFREFIFRRKLNAFGLLALAILSSIITIFCAVIGFHRTDMLIIVTVLIFILGVVQNIKLRSSFRTLKSARGIRKKTSRSSSSR